MTHLLILQGSLSDDERSVHYSSSGYYESPIDDDDDGGLSKIIYYSKLLYLTIITIRNLHLNVIFLSSLQAFAKIQIKL